MKLKNINYYEYPEDFQRLNNYQKINNTINAVIFYLVQFSMRKQNTDYLTVIENEIQNLKEYSLRISLEKIKKETEGMEF